MYGYKKKSYRTKRYTKKRTNKTRYTQRVRKPLNRRVKSFAAKRIVKPAVSVQRGYLPLSPGGMFVRLPYNEENYITVDSTSASAGVCVTHRFRLNSLYDPDITGIGHKPLQYDQLTPVPYNRYMVHAVKCYMTFTNPTNDGMYVGYRIRDNLYNAVATGGKSISYLKEMANTQVAPLNNSGKQTKTFSFYVPLHVCFGITKQQYKDAWAYGAEYNANPSHEISLDLLAFSSVGTQETVRFSCKMIYYAQLGSYSTPAQS